MLTLIEQIVLNNILGIVKDLLYNLLNNLGRK